MQKIIAIYNILIFLLNGNLLPEDLMMLVGYLFGIKTILWLHRTP